MAHKETHVWTCDVCGGQHELYGRAGLLGFPDGWRCVQLCYEDNCRMKYFGDNFHVCAACAGTAGSLAARHPARGRLLGWLWKKWKGSTPSPLGSRTPRTAGEEKE